MTRGGGHKGVHFSFVGSAMGDQTLFYELSAARGLPTWGEFGVRPESTSWARFTRLRSVILGLTLSARSVIEPVTFTSPWRLPRHTDRRVNPAEFRGKAGFRAAVSPTILKYTRRKPNQ